LLLSLFRLSIPVGKLIMVSSRVECSGFDLTLYRGVGQEQEADLAPGEESWASRLAGNMRFSPSHKEKKREISPFEKEKTASHE
jgi:hypothetical protein